MEGGVSGRSKSWRCIAGSAILTERNLLRPPAVVQPCRKRYPGVALIPVFFPSPLFGWVYLFVLFSMLLLAAFLDYRTLILPKSLTLSLLAVGIVANMIRGGWLGGELREVWILPVGTRNGILDGLLFALAGFGAGFAIFFLMWIAGSCKGGDVKLFAALAAWIGPRLAFLVLLVCLVELFLVVLFRIAQSLVGGRAVSRQPEKKRLLAFALPLALATFVVLLWSFRVDLHLAPSSPPPSESV